MYVTERLIRFARKPLADKWAAIKATFFAMPKCFQADAREQRRMYRLLTGPHAPPKVLQAGEKLYVAYRPDSEFFFKEHAEIAELSEKWIKYNDWNNAGDLTRLYAFILNVKQILSENVVGDIAELGVYRGNSAAVLAHYARMYRRRVYLFDTFEGFDDRDLAGFERGGSVRFADTSLDQVRDLVGDEDVTFVQGRFPDSIPSELYASRFCVVHIDCDLYGPAKAGLEFFYPRLSPGGLVIVHDYANPFWKGIKRAVDEYCRKIQARPVVFGDKSGTAMIRKFAGSAAASDFVPTVTSR
jgi:hypothetical protein